MRHAQRAIAWLFLAALVQVALAQAPAEFETRKGVEYASHDGTRLTGSVRFRKPVN